MIQSKESIIQVLGNLIKDPTLLSETDKYQLENNDFPERFHKIIFAAIHNLYKDGAESIDEVAIDGFLQQYGIQYEVFNQNDGVEYIQTIKEMSKEGNFDYYYERLKKFSLVREMDGLGFDVSEIYDESILNPREKEELMTKFDSMKIEDILKVYDNKMIDIKDKFESNSEARGIQAGDGVDDLLDRLKKNPDIGLPLNSPMLSSIARGSRKKKLYLRSGGTGFGKSRHILADSCKLSAKGWYDSKTNTWIKNPSTVSSLVISTEMIFEELQTPALAYIADVNEDKIVQNIMTEEEEVRVRYAANILKESPIYYEFLPDFNIKDIERTIEKNIIKHGVTHIFHDYLHSSVGILSEFAKNSGVSLREDQILLLMTDKLKQICNRADVFLLSATQLNDGWKEAWRKGEEIDQSYIRASKAVVDKVDFACIILPPSKKELDEIEPILSKDFGQHPNLVTHVFKNRGNKHTRVKIFSHINMGTMRITDLFCTNSENELIQVDELVFVSDDTEEKQEV